METDSWDGPRTNDLNELVSRLLHRREEGQKVVPGAFGDITNRAAETLVRMAYFAGMMPEEGCCPQFRIVVAARDHAVKMIGRQMLIPFDPPVPLKDVNSLRRLLPSASSHDLALDVEERRGDTGGVVVACIGIRRGYSDYRATSVLSPTPWANAVPYGLRIRADRAGFIRVSESNAVYWLRPGELVTMTDTPTLPRQDLWQHELARKLAASDKELSDLIHVLGFGWGEILRGAAARGRGGCFIVLPAVPATAQGVEPSFGTRLKFETHGPNVSAAMLEFVRSCAPISEVNSPVDQRRIETWTELRSKLRLLVQSLSYVAGVDGCTVFDADLRLIGFGGKIDDPPGPPAREFRNCWSQQQLELPDRARMGTRHYSAYRFCDRNPGAHCYIVSQDGDVTLFCSDATTVFQCKPYWPSLNRSDRS